MLVRQFDLWLAATSNLTIRDHRRSVETAKVYLCHMGGIAVLRSAVEGGPRRHLSSWRADVDEYCAHLRRAHGLSGVDTELSRIALLLFAEFVTYGRA